MITTHLPKYTLISYNRKKNGEPVGVLVAVPTNDHGSFNIGYSQCRKTDKFNKDIGLKIAIGRAEFDNTCHSLDNIPHNLRKMLPSFVQRCERYYKEKSLDERLKMSWSFIVVRNNSIEQIKTFDDFWEGADFTDNFILKIDPEMKNIGFPAYNRGENYKKDNLTIGLYKGS